MREGSTPFFIKLETLFRKITTTSDRERLKNIIALLVMRRTVAEYLFITGSAFLALFLIYII